MSNNKASNVTGELVNFLNSVTNTVIIANNKELFDRIIGYTQYCFDKEIIEPNNKYTPEVYKSLDILIEIYRIEPISKELTSFVFNYTLLIFNMNNNTMKDEALNNKCSLVDRLYKDLLTSTEVFYFLKSITKRYSNLIDYALPSVEISKNYLESFKKVN